MNSTVVMTATMEGMVAAATKPDTKPAVSRESSKFVGDSELVRSWELTEPACRQMKEHHRRLQS